MRMIEPWQVVVTTFVSLNHLYKTSGLGRIMAEQMISEFKQGMITEENYNILDGRIEEYLAEIREEILGERSEEPRS